MQTLSMRSLENSLGDPIPLAEALPTTSWVEVINKKEFAKAVLDKNSETFVVYVATLEEIMIYPSRAAQIAAL